MPNSSVTRPNERWSMDFVHDYLADRRKLRLAVHRFRYASIAKLGLHIGSGVTEGACKSLVTARVERSGRRW